MKFSYTAIALGVVIASAQIVPSYAYELGYPESAQKPGITFGGATAEAPPPGLYMFDQVFTYQSTIVGPSAPSSSTKLSADAAAAGLLIAPGWTFLGATYDAVIVQPFGSVAIGSPLNEQAVGLHNTYIVPAELSWKIGESGFYVKTGLGVFVPDGSIRAEQFWRPLVDNSAGTRRFLS